VTTTKWEKHYLKDLCLKITDGTHKAPLYTEKGVMFLSAKNIKDGQFNLTDHKFISFEEHKDLIKRCNPETEDVMLSKSGSLGDAVVVPRFEFSIFESLALLKVKKEKINPYYLKQYLCSPLSRRYFWSITSGIAVKHLHLVDLRKMPIFVPPIRMQEEIIKFLNAWEAVIEKTERLIAAKQKQFDWLATHLINQSRYHRGCVSDFTAEVSARNRNSKIDRVLSVTNHSGFVLPEEQFERRVASSNLSNYKIVKGGQYAYNPSRINVGSIARLDKWDIGVLSPMYVVFKLDESRVESDYFLHWLSSHEARQRIKKSAQGSVRETVSFSDLGSIPIPIPSLEKQRKVAEILNTAKQEINILEKLADKYRTQKRGLMQKLLTGEWRVDAAKEVA
jgi:type I restriction enzyme S subunit